jgi:hypothetical protein
VADRRMISVAANQHLELKKYLKSLVPNRTSRNHHQSARIRPAEISLTAAARAKVVQ